VLLRDVADLFAEELPNLLSPTAKPLGTRRAAEWERGAVRDAELAATGVANTECRAGLELIGHLSRSWVGGDCGDYQLHQHLESFGDGGGGNSGEEGGGEGMTVPPWVKTSLAPGRGGDGLLRQGGLAAVSGKAALQRCGLRLYNLYWQLGRCLPM